ncbi:MAG TPA: hypothetical protein VFO38_00870 [Candidatus Saccharimonadales bacterium]|nr:hypothetical protein [Candidatus Saccharimonadales bacterium]
MQPKYYGAAANYNSRSSGPQSNLQKVVIIIGGFFGLIIVLAIVSSILGSIARGPSEEYAKLTARQAGLVKLVESQRTQIRNSDLRTINSTAYLLFSGDVGTLNRLLPLFGMNEGVPEAISSQETDTTSEAKLKNAALIGTYDKVYSTVLSERMASVAALAQTVGAASSEPKVKTAIETMQANIAEIQKQLSQLQL